MDELVAQKFLHFQSIEAVMNPIGRPTFAWQILYLMQDFTEYYGCGIPCEYSEKYFSYKCFHSMGERASVLTEPVRQKLNQLFCSPNHE